MRSTTVDRRAVARAQNRDPKERAMKRTFDKPFAAMLRGAVVRELICVITLRMATFAVEGELGDEMAERLAECGGLAMQRYVRLSDYLGTIDVSPSWDPRALHGIADHVASELEKDKSASGVATRALVDVLGMLHSYKELLLAARESNEPVAEEMCVTFAIESDREAALLARMVETAARHDRSLAA